MLGRHHEKDGAAASLTGGRSGCGVEVADVCARAATTLVDWASALVGSRAAALGRQHAGTLTTRDAMTAKTTYATPQPYAAVIEAE